MGRSSPTEERAGSYPSFIADLPLRLQQLVAGWQGAERNQPLSELHNECLNAAGLGGRHLLPARLLLVEDLDETHLQAALHRLNGKWQGRQLRFRFGIAGRFDAALVPIGPAGKPPDCWLLEVRDEPPVVLDLVASDLRRRLAQWGWRGLYVESPYVFTDGRVSIGETSIRHGKKLRVDALLRAEASLPIAVVQTIHAGETR